MKIKYDNKLKEGEKERVEKILSTVSQKYDLSAIKEVGLGSLPLSNCNGTWNSSTGVIRLKRDFVDRTVWHEVGHVVYDSLLASKGREFLIAEVFGKRPEASQLFEELVKKYRKMYPSEKGYSDIWIVSEHNQQARRSSEQFADCFEKYIFPKLRDTEDEQDKGR